MQPSTDKQLLKRILAKVKRAEAWKQNWKDNEFHCSCDVLFGEYAISLGWQSNYWQSKVYGWLFVKFKGKRFLYFEDKAIIKVVDELYKIYHFWQSNFVDYFCDSECQEHIQKFIAELDKDSE